MRAVLKPKIQSPHAQDLAVTLVARTGNDKIVVERAADRITYAVDRFRLYTEGFPARRIAEQEFSRLPWRGKGVDRERRAEGDLLAGSPT